MTISPLMAGVVLEHLDESKSPRLDPRGFRVSVSMAAS